MPSASYQTIRPWKESCLSVVDSNETVARRMPSVTSPYDTFVTLRRLARRMLSSRIVDSPDSKSTRTRVPDVLTQPTREMAHRAEKRIEVFFMLLVVSHELLV